MFKISLFPPSFFKDIFTGHKILGWQAFSFFYFVLQIFHYLLIYIVEKSSVSLILATSMVIFSCSYFKIFLNVIGFLQFHYVWIQDGSAEGRMLIFCKNSKITTLYWTTIKRRMLDPTKKRYPTSKGKGESPTTW